MNKFIEQFQEILEIEDFEIKPVDNFRDFEEWDSLTMLSIIAFSDENYNVALSTIEIVNSKTVGGLKELIKSRM